MLVGGDSPHPVMGGRGNRQRLVEGLEPKFAAVFEDCWESALRLSPRDCPQVKAHVVCALTTHAVHQSATDLISGGEVTSLQICHRAAARTIHQDAPFTTHCFGN